MGRWVGAGARRLSVAEQTNKKGLPIGSIGQRRTGQPAPSHAKELLQELNSQRARRALISMFGSVAAGVRLGLLSVQTTRAFAAQDEHPTRKIVASLNQLLSHWTTSWRSAAQAADGRGAASSRGPLPLLPPLPVRQTMRLLFAFPICVFSHCCFFCDLCVFVSDEVRRRRTPPFGCCVLPLLLSPWARRIGTS